MKANLRIRLLNQDTSWVNALEELWGLMYEPPHKATLAMHATREGIGTCYEILGKTTKPPDGYRKFSHALRYAEFTNHSGWEGIVSFTAASMRDGFSPPDDATGRTEEFPRQANLTGDLASDYLRFREDFQVEKHSYIGRAMLTVGYCGFARHRFGVANGAELKRMLEEAQQGSRQAHELARTLRARDAENSGADSATQRDRHRWQQVAARLSKITVYSEE